ncbi:MAG TPA: YncE family protein [Gemmatimonadaceae bacterium]|nr:YncE family protein [Gemmatimonadaceae bacterium]
MTPVVGRRPRRRAVRASLSVLGGAGHGLAGIARGAVTLSLGSAACASSPRVDPPAPVPAPETTAVAATGTARPAPPDKDYLVFVASEGNDKVFLVRFGPGGARVEREHRMGTNPTELVGPHGLGVSPDGRHYYVSTAHGMPNGALWKYTTQGDSLVGKVDLASFPATLQVSPNGAFAFVVNFNLYGDPVTSSVSVVYVDRMIEVARIPTCVMPHGSRLDPKGTKHYSACMMNDALVEIDATQLSVRRHFVLAKGKERGIPGAPARTGPVQAGHDMSGHGMEAPKPGDVSCSPTWAQPSADGASVFVACNKSNEIVEVDANAWTLKRRFATGDGTYNLAATRDGRLLVGTNKRGKSVSIIEIATGRELARIPTLRRVPSGVALSADDRYAFVTVEGVGSEPGTLEVIDLRALTRVASVEIGPQAGGVDFWKTEPAR